jgi:nucleotide-binding universal stress UspA family protein
LIGEFRRVLVTVDGSESAARAARVAIALVKKFGSEIIVCHIIPRPAYFFSRPRTPTVTLPDLSDYLSQYFSSARRETKALLDEIVKLAEAEGAKASELIIENVFSVLEAIVINAATRNVDLIVIGNRGLSGFKKLLMGSVSASVVSHADYSVLVVK